MAVPSSIRLLAILISQQRDHNMNAAECFKTVSGDVVAWIEQSDTVHLKTVNEYGDPVELTAEELKTLIDGLSRLYNIIKDE